MIRLIWVHFTPLYISKARTIDHYIRSCDPHIGIHAFLISNIHIIDIRFKQLILPFIQKTHQCFPHSAFRPYDPDRFHFTAHRTVPSFSYLHIFKNTHEKSNRPSGLVTSWSLALTDPACISPLQYTVPFLKCQHLHFSGICLFRNVY